MRARKGVSPRKDIPQTLSSVRGIPKKVYVAKKVSRSNAAEDNHSLSEDQGSQEENAIDNISQDQDSATESHLKEKEQSENAPEPESYSKGKGKLPSRLRIKKELQTSSHDEFKHPIIDEGTPGK